MLGKFAAFIVVLTILAVPTAQAATTDNATAVASPGPYLVDTPITFTSTTPCTVGCRLIWKYLSGTRLGVQLGEGVSVQRAFSTPGVKTVELRLTESCVGTSRLVCASVAYVSVFVEGAPPPVADTTAPTITASGLQAEATGPNTVVNYTFDASDPDDAVVSQSCTPDSGSSFPVGTTTIDCTAVDSNGNVGTAAFAVVVTDTTAPSLSVPGPITVEAISPAGAAVTFTATASDLVDGPVTPACSIPSGAVFPIGDTTVTCTATDSHGNTSAAGTFVVHVQGAAGELTGLLDQTAGLRHGVPDRVRELISAVSNGPGRVALACRLLGDIDQRLRERDDNRLTTARRDALLGEVARIAHVIGCTP